MILAPEIGVSVMTKRIRSGDVLLQAERTKRNARAESFGGARALSARILFDGVSGDFDHGY
jgi:hypothetical protein